MEHYIKCTYTTDLNIDEKTRCNVQYFPLSYFTDLEEFAMRTVSYGNFSNALEMQKCSEKHPDPRANNGNTKNVVIA